jgi:transposase
MITVPSGIRVFVATMPVDFRRADSLAALVREQLKRDPFSGTIDRLKILGWGWIRGGVVLEAARAWIVSLAADQQ